MKYLYAIITWLMFVAWISIYLFFDWRAGSNGVAFIYWLVAFLLENNLIVITWKENKS